jgi:hypothetical protein
VRYSVAVRQRRHRIERQRPAVAEREDGLRWTAMS